MPGNRAAGAKRRHARGLALDRGDRSAGTRADRGLLPALRRALPGPRRRRRPEPGRRQRGHGPGEQQQRLPGPAHGPGTGPGDPVHHGAARLAGRETQAGLWGSLLPAAWSYMLACRARGLGTAWTTLHLHYETEIAALLGLPGDIRQGALIPTAYYTGDTFRPAARLRCRTCCTSITGNRQGRPRRAVRAGTTGNPPQARHRSRRVTVHCRHGRAQPPPKFSRPYPCSFTHTETWAGSRACRTTTARSSRTALWSTAFFSLAEKAATMRSASYRGAVEPAVHGARDRSHPAHDQHREEHGFDHTPPRRRTRGVALRRLRTGWFKWLWHVG